MPRVETKQREIEWKLEHLDKSQEWTELGCSQILPKMQGHKIDDEIRNVKSKISNLKVCGIQLDDYCRKQAEAVAAQSDASLHPQAGRVDLLEDDGGDEDDDEADLAIETDGWETVS
eukprot:SAG11_NODE_24088_length_378_cov_0.931900_1_plen_116_part_10